MQPGYRTILSEMILAQSAAAGAFADVTARYTLLVGQQYQAALASLGSGRSSRTVAPGSPKNCCRRRQISVVPLLACHGFR